MRHVSPTWLRGSSLSAGRPAGRTGRPAPARLGCGFSLLELVLVLAIIVTLAAIAVPRYGSSAARYRADFAARRIAEDLEYARTRATTSSAGQTVQFSLDPDQYQIFDTAGALEVSDQYVVRLSDPPSEATLVSLNLGGDGKVVFDGWGVPDSGGSVTIKVGQEKRTVLIDADTGRATVQ